MIWGFSVGKHPKSFNYSQILKDSKDKSNILKNDNYGSGYVSWFKSKWVDDPKN